jgi:hypothetical protein
MSLYSNLVQSLIIVLHPDWSPLHRFHDRLLTVYHHVTVVITWYYLGHFHSQLQGSVFLIISGFCVAFVLFIFVLCLVFMAVLSSPPVLSWGFRVGNITTRNKKLKIAQNGWHHDTQTNTNTIRHEPSDKQLGAKTNRTSFLCGNYENYVPFVFSSQLSVRGLMSYLCHLCLLAHSGF